MGGSRGGGEVVDGPEGEGEESGEAVVGPEGWGGGTETVDAAEMEMMVR